MTCCQYFSVVLCVFPIDYTFRWARIDFAVAEKVPTTACIRDGHAFELHLKSDGVFALYPSKQLTALRSLQFKAFRHSLLTLQVRDSFPSLRQDHYSYCCCSISPPERIAALQLDTLDHQPLSRRIQDTVTSPLNLRQAGRVAEASLGLQVLPVLDLAAHARVYLYAACRPLGGWSKLLYFAPNEPEPPAPAATGSSFANMMEICHHFSSPNPGVPEAATSRNLVL